MVSSSANSAVDFADSTDAQVVSTGIGMGKDTCSRPMPTANAPDNVAPASTAPVAASPV